MSGSRGMSWCCGGRVGVRAGRVLLLLAGLVVLLLGVGVSSAWGSVGWSVHDAAEPSSFAANEVACGRLCDRYQLLLHNDGDEAAQPEVTVTDTFPAGILVVEAESGYHVDQVEWSCTIAAGEGSVTCSYPDAVPAGGYAPRLTFYVTEPTLAMEQEYAETKVALKNVVRVEGGGGPESVSVQETVLGRPASFELSEFVFAPQEPGGGRAVVAGGHPWQVTSTFGLPTHKTPPEAQSLAFEPTKDLKSIDVELPAGLVGDPLATERCTESVLREGECPPGSAVGVFALQSGSNKASYFESTRETKSTNGVFGCCTDVYNMVPEAGFPAEFGFDYGETVPIVFYANLVHTGTGYRVRVTVPGVGVTKALIGTSITFFGEPGARVFHEGEPSVPASEKAFLSDPSDCTAEAEGVAGPGRVPRVGGVPVTAGELDSRMELAPWSEPGPEHVIHGETPAFSSLSGCAGLAARFRPSLVMAPSPAGSGVSEEGSSEADEPSAYSVNLKLPQAASFHEPATPDLRQASVVLPAGVSVSPSAANGIAGCQATGAEGINLGSGDIGVGGQDLGDPEATELGAGSGRVGGNGSIYDDGFYHTAAGHCPPASIVASAEVCTPLLANRANSEGHVQEGVAACEAGTGIAPLQGHVFLAQPKCGGEGQPQCTTASATNGELFGVYLELSGDGVIVKLPGEVQADPVTGQLTGTFAENPQLPFSDLKLHFEGGPRASLANPQTCGAFTTTSSLVSWAAEASALPVTGSNSFGIGGCPAGATPFSPSFTAGTVSPAAGANTSFVMTFSRQDREQDLSGVTLQEPDGLVGKIAGIPLCGEAQANAGSCPAESQIGVASATAGAGPEPFQQTGGRVYLTGAYKGGPFGLSVVVPTKAGPFNLGDEVVRASIHINPGTSAVTVISNPLPQIKDGVPFRLRSVSVTINRPEFIRNPTSCVQQSVTATLTGSEGAAANVSTPFAASGCPSLPFKPSYTYSTQAKTSKADGASLTVKVAQTPGEANIARVDLTIPQILPSRLTTIQKACLAATFEANPAGCPEGSDIGTGTAYTPVLNVPLSGPAYLVSHGGAAFPDVEFVLQGEGVTIILDGKTDIKKGVTYSRFETVPDAPVTSFETVLPEGPHSALTTEKPGQTNLCGTTKTTTTKKKITRRVHGKRRKVTVTVKKTLTTPLALTIPTVITGQNGAVISQNTKVTVTGCSTPNPAAKAKAARKKTAASKK